jgi:hypothetical protein
MTKQLKWPGINITQSDRDLVSRITDADGYLTHINIKDLLMMAAAISVKKKLPKTNINSEEKYAQNIAHPTLMNQADYEEFRQYIALIYFLTAGNRKIENSNDATAMVKNFVDQAQRGLRYLEINYVNSKSGSDDMMDELLKHLKKN